MTSSLQNTTYAERLAERRAAIQQTAAARHAAFPQYAGHWSGTEWKLARIGRRVNTKMGMAFEAGEVTIARKDVTGHTAYSVRNGIDTSLGKSTTVTFLE